MALVLEDGTGLANSNSYGSVVAFKAYHDARGNSYSGKTDPQIEYALINGTDFIDLRWGPMFRGVKLKDTQALEWPRDDVYLPNGTEIVGLPAALTNGLFEYALAILNGSALWITPTADASGRAVQSQSKTVGPISTSVTYQTGAQPERALRLPKADSLMRTLTAPAGVIRG